MKPSFYILIAAPCAVMTIPCSAQESEVGQDRYAAMVRNVDLHPATAAAARRVVARFDAAASAVCGLSSFSLREVVADGRKAPCWRDAMAVALARTDAPLLQTAYHRIVEKGLQ